MKLAYHDNLTMQPFCFFRCVVAIIKSCWFFFFPFLIESHFLWPTCFNEKYSLLISCEAYLRIFFQNSCLTLFFWEALLETEVLIDVFLVYHNASVLRVDVIYVVCILRLFSALLADRRERRKEPGYTRLKKMAVVHLTRMLCELSSKKTA